MQDPYEFCRCGSGKKNRWCCAPLEQEIEKAWKQASQGQHEGALRTVETLIAANTENPEVYGRKAELLMALGRPADAEAVLEKAFALRPDYPFGNFLKASMRLEEGELQGGLILARKATDAYHPAANGPLTKVFGLIFEAEKALNHPLAARAALKSILRLQANSVEAKAIFDEVYGEKSQLPEVARREYSLLPPPSVAARRVAWDKAAKAHGGPRLSSLVKVFEEITKGDANDAPAWFNLALAYSWLGNNGKALEAIDHYLKLETDEGRATLGGALAEVLRAGRGLEDRCDQIEHIFEVPVRDVQALTRFLQKLVEERRFNPFGKNDEDQAITGFLMKPQSSLVLAGDSGPRYAHVGGFLMAAPNGLQIRARNMKYLEELRNEARLALGLAINDGRVRSIGTLENPFLEISIINLSSDPKQGDIQSKQLEALKHHFLEVWVNQPLKSLGGQTPRQAVATRDGKFRTLGILRFYESYAESFADLGFRFDMVKAELGLVEKKTDEGTQAPVQAESTGLAGQDESAVLDKAFKEARREDKDDEAESIGRKIIELAPAQLPDRAAVFLFLGRRKIALGQFDEAVSFLSRGADFDKDHNQGLKTGDLNMALAQAYAKAGKTNEAVELIVNTVKTHGSNLTLGAKGVEALLGMKRAKDALGLAEQAHREAVHQQNRDAEGHLNELIEVARKQANG